MRNQLQERDFPQRCSVPNVKKWEVCPACAGNALTRGIIQLCPIAVGLKKAMVARALGFNLLSDLPEPFKVEPGTFILVSYVVASHAS